MGTAGPSPCDQGEPLARSGEPTHVSRGALTLSHREWGRLGETVAVMRPRALRPPGQTRDPQGLVDSHARFEFAGFSTGCLGLGGLDERTCQAQQRFGSNELEFWWFL